MNHTEPLFLPLRERDVRAAERFELDTLASRRAPARPSALRRLVAAVRGARDAGDVHRS